jgi:hypothetical protein
MSKWPDDISEFEDYPDEIVEEIDENMNESDFEIPDVWWREHIEKIEDPEMRENEIEAAERLIEKKIDLIERLESGEITQDRYDDEYLLRLRSEERKAATRCGLASEGLTYDDLGDISEDNSFISKGDPKLMDIKDEIKEVIGSMGPEAAQELADRKLEEGEISKEAHETISRQVRLHGK